MAEARERAGSEEPRAQVTSVGDLLAAVGGIQATGRELWFRGHANVTWELTPSVLRDPDLALAERPMIARFRQEAAVAGLPYAFDQWGWISFAQHHKLPTRLLDWATSPLTGLYFACEIPNDLPDGAVEPDGQLHVLRPNALNEIAGDKDGGYPRLLSEDDDVLRDYLPGQDGSNRWSPRAVVAPLLFERIRVQSGTFTVHQAPSPGDEPPAIDGALDSLVVPSAAKSGVRSELAVLGVDEASIYGDLDRMSRRIRRKHERGAQ